MSCKHIEPSSLSLIPSLHAKFYRADDRYAIGSANLTNAALGWSAQSKRRITNLR